MRLRMSTHTIGTEMAKSTGIVLTATGISFGNEWIQDPTHPNFRILVAGGIVALIFSGVERINEQAGVGLSILMFITVMVTPFKGRSPAQTLLASTIAKPGA